MEDLRAHTFRLRDGSGCRIAVDLNAVVAVSEVRSSYGDHSTRIFLRGGGIRDVDCLFDDAVRLVWGDSAEVGAGR